VLGKKKVTTRCWEGKKKKGGVEMWRAPWGKKKPKTSKKGANLGKKGKKSERIIVEKMQTGKP